MLKIYLIILEVSLITTSSFSQLKMSDLSTIRLGTSFSESQYIKDKYSKRPTLMKGDFLNTYKIIYEKSPFDYYNDADHTFQYVKDSLSSVVVEYKFGANRLSDFGRLLRQIVSDLKADPQKELLKEYSNLNVEKEIAFAEKECKRYNTESEYDNATFLKHNSANSVFFIKNSLQQDNRFITVSVWFTNGTYPLNYPEPDKDGYINFDSRNKLDIYYGSFMMVSITLTNTKLQDLYYLGIEKKISYKSINELSDTKINLKYVNGVYKLPVKINGIMTLDFILDLGASDVSISPDIFSVLYKAGTIKDEDFIGNQTYQLADGTTIKSDIVNIKNLTIGDIKIENVRASISKSINAPLLLGQSALRKLGKYSIDNNRNVLIIQ
jgi:predicted aspartyl protease